MTGCSRAGSRKVWCVVCSCAAAGGTAAVSKVTVGVGPGGAQCGHVVCIALAQPGAEVARASGAL